MSKNSPIEQKIVQMSKKNSSNEQKNSSNEQKNSLNEQKIASPGRSAWPPSLF